MNTKWIQKTFRGNIERKNVLSLWNICDGARCGWWALMMVVAEKWKYILSLFMKSGRMCFHFSLLLFMDDGIVAEKWKDVLSPYAWKSLGFPSVRRSLPSAGHRSPSPAGWKENIIVIFCCCFFLLCLARWGLAGKKRKGGRYCFFIIVVVVVLIVIFLLQLFFVQKVFSWEEGNVNGGC